MAERYDEATVELVATKLGGLIGESWMDWQGHAIAALDALADAGLLVPPGATTVDVWEVRSQGGVVRKVYTREEADAVMESCRPSMQQRTEITTRWAEVAHLPDSPKCYRCGTPGHVDWADISTFGEMPKSAFMPGESYCVTPGCTDEDGSRRLWPPTVTVELRRSADKTFLVWHGESR